MIKDYVEKHIGEVPDDVFDLAGMITKNFIIGELGGHARLNLVKELMLDVTIKIMGYRLQAWKEA